MRIYSIRLRVGGDGLGEHIEFKRVRVVRDEAVVSVLEIHQFSDVAFPHKIAGKSLIENDEAGDEVETGIRVLAALDKLTEAVVDSLVEETPAVPHKKLLLPDSLLVAFRLVVDLIEEDDFVQHIAIVLGGSVDEFKGGTEGDARLASEAAGELDSDAATDEAVARGLKELAFEAGTFKNAVDSPLRSGDQRRVGAIGFKIDLRRASEHEAGFALNELFDKIDAFFGRLVIQPGGNSPILSLAVVELIEPQGFPDVLQNRLSPQPPQFGKNKISSIDSQSDHPEK